MSHVEDYLNISEPILYDNSVSNIEYITQDPNAGTNLNSPSPINLVINPTSDWLLPSKSYLYIEGRVTNPDGSPITPITHNYTPHVWRDYALLNNFFPYLFQTMTYNLNDKPIEMFNNPGQCTTIKHLVTKPRQFNGLDMGWELDTYDGQATANDFPYFPMKPFDPTDMITADPNNPTQAEVVAFVQQLFNDFEVINPIVSPGIPTAADIQDPAKGGITGALTADMGLKLVNWMVGLFNAGTDLPLIPITATAMTDKTRAVFIAYINFNLIFQLNYVIASLTSDPLRYNTGFKKRKDLLFDPVQNVMLDQNSGMFSFRIPLSFLFNFCEGYQKVLYNCKHEIQLNRQTLYTPIFRSNTYSTNVPPKLTLNLMRWYMPKVTPNDNQKALMLKEIEMGIEVDLAFMSKKIDQFSLSTNQLTSTYTAQLNYQSGIEKPRYIVAGFQTVDTADPYYTDPTNINYALFNGTNLNGLNQFMIDVNYVNLRINGTLYQLMDYSNNFNTNAIARWYNEYKKFKQSYSGDMSEEDMIDYYAFRNLYRLYVFDISKQTENLIAGGSAIVSLEFNFNQPSVAPVNTLKTDLYVVSFFDRAYKLKSDGSRQILVS